MTTTISHPGPAPAEERHSADPPTPRRWWRRPWVVPLMVVAAAFVAFSVPPYLTGDPSRSRVPVHPEFGWYYPLLVTHIISGSIALLAGCFQLWPWFRRRHPVAHRWVGRAYFFGGVFPAGVAVLAIAPLSSTGVVSRFGNTALALLWLPISIAGYRMARQRRFAEHRRWMIRSFALTTSIVVNRVWGAVLLVLLSPQSLEGTAAGGLLAPDDHAAMAAVGVASWLSWIVNLLIAEWWLERTDIARRHRRQGRTPSRRR